MIALLKRLITPMCGAFIGLIAQAAAPVVAYAETSPNIVWASEDTQGRMIRQIWSDLPSARFRVSSTQLDSLQGHILYPYVHEARLRARLNSNYYPELDSEIIGFLQSYGDLPTADRLRLAWLDGLAARNQWGTLLNQTKTTDPLNTQCDGVYAKFLLRDTAGIPVGQIFEEMRRLWVIGESFDDACLRVTGALQVNGQLTPDLIQKRIHNLILSGNGHQLAGAPWLSPEKRAAFARANSYWAQQSWGRLYQEPFDSQLDADSAFFLLHRLAQLKGKLPGAHYESAMRLYPSLSATYGLSENQKYAVIRPIGLTLAIKRDMSAMSWLAQLPDAEDDKMVREWRIAHGLWQGDWARVNNWIAALPQEEREQPRWQYWKARTLEKLNQASAARQIYQALQAHPSYYTWLAAARLDQPYQIREVRIQSDSSIQQKLLSQSSVARARELYRMGLDKDAKREWRNIIARSSKPEIEQIALLQRQDNWYGESMLTLGNADLFHDLELRYPLLYSEQINFAAQEFGVPVAWVYGITRSESLFNPNIRSSVGAGGLMQLMPATAREVARRSGISLTYGVFEPQTNVRLGSSYLRSMLSKFNGFMPLATAAYNAGPGKIPRWMHPNGNIDGDIWVENVPLEETQTYVKRVLEAQTAYEWRLDGKVTSANVRVPPVNTQVVFGIINPMPSGDPLDNAPAIPKQAEPPVSRFVPLPANVREPARLLGETDSRTPPAIGEHTFPLAAAE